MIKLYLCLILCAILTSCASSYQIIKKSNDNCPLWVQGPQKGIVVGISEIPLAGKYDHKFTQASKKALDDVKIAIAQSIVVKVKSIETLERKAVMANMLEEYLEKFNSLTVQKTGVIPGLVGVSMDKASDFYWELYKKEKRYYLRYCIKYPFSEVERLELIKKWERNLAQKNKIIETLEHNINSYKYVEQIQSDIVKANSALGILSEDLEIKAKIILERLKSKLSNITIVCVKNTPGKLSFQLKSNGKLICTDRTPSVNSNCCEIKDISCTNGIYQVTYGYDSCNPFDSYISLKFDFGDQKINENFVIDLKGTRLTKVSNKILSPISYECYDTGFFQCDKSRMYFTLNSKYAGKFEISKIEMDLIDRYGHIDESIVIDHLSIRKNGEGNHSFTVHSGGFSSIGIEKASGVVHYRNLYTCKNESFSFKNIEFKK